MSISTYNLLMLLATAASAVGTIGAVAVALYLAERQYRPRVEVDADIRLVIEPGESFRDAPEFCLISLVNIGATPANVSTLWWRTGWPWRGGFIQNPSDHHLSGQLPNMLQPGTRADIFFPLNEFAARTAPLRDNLNGRRFSRLAWRRLRVGVRLVTGQAYWTKPSKELLAVLQTGTHKGADAA